MRLIWVLLRRNLRAFARDRLIVFFTLLTPLIFIFLFIVFYRTMVSTQVKGDFLSASMAVILGLCDSWLFASAVLLATFTSTLGMLNTFVLDRETGRFSDYLVSPVRRWQLAIGYILSTWVVSVVISSALMLLGPLWALIQGQTVMGPLDILKAIGAIALSALVFASLNTLVATFITSWAAFGGYAIAMGASIGFLAFCYVPPVSLSQTVNTVLGLMVFAQGAALIRQPIMGPAIAKLMEVVPPDRLVEADSGIKTSLAVTLDIGSHTLPSGLIVAVLLAWAVLLTALSSWRLSRVIH
jgi:multidrug/hemolysin transport system permease protein